MQQSRDERSLGELFGELARETGTLVRQEVELAKTEISQKATSVGKDIGYMAVGGFIAYAGLLAILAAIIFALVAIGLPAWLSALLVGLTVAAAGYLLIQKGRDALKRSNLTPKRTIDTLKEDAEWAKQQMR